MIKYVQIILILGLIGCIQTPYNHFKDKDLTGQTPPSDVIFIPGKGSISSFYIGVSEEPNINYVAYLNWLRNVYLDYPEVPLDAKIKFKTVTDVLRFNDPQQVYHMEHPAFSYYPIVGATWSQIQNYLQWKTDRVNEAILIENGILEWDPNQINEENFSSESYLYGQYMGKTGKQVISEKGPGNPRQTRNVQWEDGILLAGYRLPTEAEWELLAQENSINEYVGNFPYGKGYPILKWTTNKVRKASYDWDYSGINLPDYDNYWKTSTLPNPKKIKNYNQGIQGPYVSKSHPNPSNVAGNVREWLLDVYKEEKQLNYASLQEHFWQNGFETREEKMGGIYDSDGVIDLKDSLGKLAFRILGINSDGSPLWAIPPNRGRQYILDGYDTIRNYIDPKTHVYTNDIKTFYKTYQTQLTQLYLQQHLPSYQRDTTFNLLKSLERLVQYNQYYGYQQQHNIPKEALDSACHNWTKILWEKEFKMGCVAIGLVNPIAYYRDSNGMYYPTILPKYKTIITNHNNSKRLVRGGTWQNPDFNLRESLHQDSARSDIGFRCLLPYTSIPIKKKYKVNWD